MTTISPVTVEIIRSALIQAAEDMNRALIRSAYTPTIYEGKDCAVALLDRNHNVLGQSSGLPIFLGNLEECTRYTENLLGADCWQPGDVWVLNDSYIGGTHLNDCTVFAPIFVDDELVGFAASRAHWIDMGSKDPGGSMDSTNIYQDGLRFPPVRLIAGGVEVPDIMRLVSLNVRFPYETLGDMHAQVACARMGAKRLGEIYARYGSDTLAAAREEIFKQTDALERERIREIPDGEYYAEGYLDNDGVNLDTRLKVSVRVIVDGETMRIDLTDSADQAEGPVNCGAAQAVSAARVGYKLLISPEVSLNGGSFGPLDVDVRDGSLLGAREPAACQYYYSSLGMLIDLVVKALSDVVPERIAAGSYGDSMIIQFTGDDPRSGKPFVTLEATVGGWGAWDGEDGETALINNVNGSLRDLPVEVVETLYPLRVHEYRIRKDSGGRGQYRGGNGVVRKYEMLADLDLSLWWERSVTPAWGAAGGESGTPPRVTINPGEPDEVSMLKANSRRVTRGTIIRCESGGGGGFGDPAKRDSAAIERDVAVGMVTAG
ncbi:hydantoinase B/oxoprolinase family protein [Spelaeicoccus albus]|uniref:N-methylhydantoinase B n=1 Tax=Spelaeicoccus albus TaxID=1280376 RepID=A0A7Z0D1H3_9MICO|nr:hydantoinase B/oxoprolinase family protein [Spelaeicoccus albus]NYI67028.1 N-methylhydantoinase B [Spelaeicoccus albus]